MTGPAAGLTEADGGRAPRSGLGAELSRLPAEDSLLAQVVREEEEREHGGLGDVGLEHVAVHEARLVGDAGVGGVLARHLEELAVVLDAERARAAPGGGDHVAAVAGAEVDHVVLPSDARHVEHLLDQGVGGGYPDHVLARLSDVGGGLGLRRCGGRDESEGGERVIQAPSETVPGKLYSESKRPPPTRTGI